jgi:GNAT superfamily N-acetyltransferase
VPEGLQAVRRVDGSGLSSLLAEADREQVLLPVARVLEADGLALPEEWRAVVRRRRLGRDERLLVALELAHRLRGRGVLHAFLKGFGSELSYRPGYCRQFGDLDLAIPHTGLLAPVDVVLRQGGFHHESFVVRRASGDPARSGTGSGSAVAVYRAESAVEPEEGVVIEILAGAQPLFWGSSARFPRPPWRLRRVAAGDAYLEVPGPEEAFLIVLGEQVERDVLRVRDLWDLHLAEEALGHDGLPAAVAERMGRLALVGEHRRYRRELARLLRGPSSSPPVRAGGALVSARRALTHAAPYAHQRTGIPGALALAWRGFLLDRFSRGCATPLSRRVAERFDTPHRLLAWRDRGFHLQAERLDDRLDPTLRWLDGAGGPAVGSPLGRFRLHVLRAGAVSGSPDGADDSDGEWRIVRLGPAGARRAARWASRDARPSFETGGWRGELFAAFRGAVCGGLVVATGAEGWRGLEEGLVHPCVVRKRLAGDELRDDLLATLAVAAAARGWVALRLHLPYRTGRPPPGWEHHHAVLRKELPRGDREARTEPLRGPTPESRTGSGPDAVRVRSAGSGDTGYVRSCLERGLAAGLTAWELGVVTEADLAARAEERVAELGGGARAWIAERDGRRLGAAFASLESADPETGRREARLHDAWVEPEARRLGLARLLVREVERDLAAAGVGSIVATARRPNRRETERLCDELLRDGWRPREEVWRLPLAPGKPGAPAQPAEGSEPLSTRNTISVEKTKRSISQPVSAASSSKRAV